MMNVGAKLAATILPAWFENFVFDRTWKKRADHFENSTASVIPRSMKPSVTSIILNQSSNAETIVIPKSRWISRCFVRKAVL